MSDYSGGFSTLFGFSRGMDQDELLAVEDFLRDAWEAQYGVPPSSFSSDLERLRALFKTGVSGKRLRESVSNLERISQPMPSLPESVFVTVDDQRGLITPEGRALLEELTNMRERDSFVIDRDSMLRATSRVAQAYGSWQRAWLETQLSGTGLRPGSYGFVLFLLVNGSTDERAALRLPAAVGEERELANALIPIMDTFAIGIGGRPTPKKESGRLRSNWQVTEARRQLYGHIARDDRAGDAFFWIVDEDNTTEVLAKRLSTRSSLSLETLEQALDDLKKEYSRSRPALSAWGAAHDRRLHTEYVCRQLVQGFIGERAKT